MGIDYQKDDALFSFVDYMRCNFHCYQHIHQFLCYVYVPKCDPVLKKVIHPCREMCREAKKAPCDHYQKNFEHINCDYLPSLRGDISCIYKRVFCMNPSTVTNAIVIANGNFLYDRVEYFCDEGFEIVGKKNC